MNKRIACGIYFSCCDLYMVDISKEFNIELSGFIYKVNPITMTISKNKNKNIIETHKILELTSNHISFNPFKL